MLKKILSSTAVVVILNFLVVTSQAWGCSYVSGEVEMPECMVR